MVGKVLTNNGLVEPVKSGRRTTDFKLKSKANSEAQRASLVALSNNIQDYLINEVMSYRSTSPLTVSTFQVLHDTIC